MEKAVRSFIKKHTLLHRGARVLVGVSGGPDSMALLHFLTKVSAEWELDVQVLSIDHQLRGRDSQMDVHYVKEICTAWGLPFHGTSFDVKSYADRERLSIEVAARKLRYRFFTEKMKELEADYLALGHHGDDQVETLLMKLVRTASSTAYSGIPVTRKLAGGMIVRPLLAVTKQEIESYCKANGIIPRIDMTNLESEHTRNYYRHYVVPLLKKKNANIHQTAQHLAETLEEDEAFLRSEAEKVFQDTVMIIEQKQQVTLEINSFKKHHHSLQRRAFHLILNYLYKSLPEKVSYIHEQQFFDLIGDRSGNKTLDFPLGLKLNRAYDKLNFYFEYSNPHKVSFHQTLTIPGSTSLPDGSVITATYTTARGKETPYTLHLAASELSFPLHVRTRVHGDRMSWTGLEGTKKLKDIFIDAKIPLEKRASWPIIVDNDGNILWLIGLRKGKQREVDDQKYLYLQFEKGNQ